ncbi:uncharacterized mitochondrial protein AtMg00820-like [Vicia villosa]|uniref:uncharacterized mitochondrial protein AtMg00820-like n=1 Tax=Vicia villosa TaxID=3911 RepID=UPI00273C2800|nr:uncharacterized mitochondrial protein AtMg00820-like [Vicia villosa]
MNDSKWLAAMQEELRAIEKNKTWELVERSSKKLIHMKWVYKFKLRPNSDIAKYKAWLVARGFLQKPDINFDEVHAPIARLEIIRIVVATIVRRIFKGWSLNTQVKEYAREGKGGL